MSATIIQFPGARPSRQEIDAGISLMRKCAAPDVSAEQRGFLAGYMMGVIKGTSMPSAAIAKPPKH